jgi:hypothetical protein
VASQSRKGFKADCTGGWAKAMISTTGCAAHAAPMEQSKVTADAFLIKIRRLIFMLEVS